MAGRREIDDLKPIDKATLGVVSESPGRNASKRTGSLEMNERWRPRRFVFVEGTMSSEQADRSLLLTPAGW